MRPLPTDAVPAEVHISCRNLWKIFGLSGSGRISQEEALAAADDPKRGVVVGLRDVSIDIRRGETFVIMGLSGSGKSTLVRCMSRLAEPTAGSITFDGIDLLAASEQQLIDIRRHKMGMVFQHFALLPHLTVVDNVAFPLKIQGIGKDERRERAPRRSSTSSASRGASTTILVNSPVASSSASASPARWR